MRIETIEDLVTEVLQLHTRAICWKWNTDSSPEQTAFMMLEESMKTLLDSFVTLSIGRFSRIGEHYFNDISYMSYRSEYIVSLREAISEFLIEKIKSPNVEYSPELEHVLVDMIKILTKFEYLIYLTQ